MVCRVYNEGVGLRFSVPDQGHLKGRNFAFDFAFNASEDFSAYFPNGEAMPVGPLRLSEWSANPKERPMPALFDLGRGRFMGLLESDLYSARPFESAKLSIGKGSREIRSIVSATAVENGFVTPWRVILIGESLGDLLLNNAPLNLAAPCQLDDPDWIKPGKGLWTGEFMDTTMAISSTEPTRGVICA